MKIINNGSWMARKCMNVKPGILYELITPLYCELAFIKLNKSNNKNEFKVI